jgi:putative phosphoribosyl transferase
MASSTRSTGIPARRTIAATLAEEAPPCRGGVGFVGAGTEWSRKLGRSAQDQRPTVIPMTKAPPQHNIEIRPLGLRGLWRVPDRASGIVAFVHGSGSSRFSPRNAQVAHAFNEAGIATLLFDLLLPGEAQDRRMVFDIPLLAGRLEEALDWIAGEKNTAELSVGLFGASTGAAAALTAAARRPERIAAVVSRGGRPDLAANALASVLAPTLLIVGELDTVVIELNHRAMAQLACPVRLEIVPGATHLFEQAGALDRVISLSTAWFSQHLEQRVG